MKSMEYWSVFEKSGKLRDYLCFCEARRRNASTTVPANTDERRESEDQSSL